MTNNLNCYSCWQKSVCSRRIPLPKFSAQRFSHFKNMNSEWYITKKIPFIVNNNKYASPMVRPKMAEYGVDLPNSSNKDLPVE